jgi:lipopolysaccharide transport system permease protein
VPGKPSESAVGSDATGTGSPASVPVAETTIVQRIRPLGRWPGVGWSELWRGREILYFLVWRDAKIRYRQTVLGVAWAVLQPVATVAAFSLIFGRFAGLDQRTGGVPYPIYVLAGLIPWNLFSSSITASSQSLVASANMLTKIYFPRLIIPIAAVGTALIDFLISLCVLAVLMAYYRLPLGSAALLLPLFSLGAVAVALGVGTLLSALTVAYRDFRYVTPFMVQFWMFATPVMYPLDIIPARWRIPLYLNPMTGALEGFRAALLATPLDWPLLSVSATVSAALLALGVLYFRAVEKGFADIV